MGSWWPFAPRNYIFIRRLCARQRIKKDKAMFQESSAKYNMALNCAVPSGLVQVSTLLHDKATKRRICLYKRTPTIPIQHPLPLSISARVSFQWPFILSKDNPSCSTLLTAPLSNTDQGYMASHDEIWPWPDGYKTQPWPRYWINYQIHPKSSTTTTTTNTGDKLTATLTDHK